MKRLPLWRRPFFARRTLDIGAGHNPFQGVTHVLEIDLHEGGERGGNELLVPQGACLVAGAATALPFHTGAFDYVYASHVLEHVDAPEPACREITRVGTAGYIETPSPFLEQGLALRDETSPEHWFHKWLVFALGDDQLVFEPKTPQEVLKFCSCPDGQFMREFYDQVDFRSAQHCFRRKSKTTIFYWRAGFDVEIRDHTVDCRTEGQACRFRGMKSMLLASCNDLLRAPRVLRLRRNFPQCRALFERYGHRTLLIP